MYQLCMVKFFFFFWDGSLPLRRKIINSCCIGNIKMCMGRHYYYLERRVRVEKYISQYVNTLPFFDVYISHLETISFHKKWKIIMLQQHIVPWNEIRIEKKKEENSRSIGSTGTERTLLFRYENFVNECCIKEGEEIRIDSHKTYTYNECWKHFLRFIYGEGSKNLYFHYQDDSVHLICSTSDDNWKIW